MTDASLPTTRYREYARQQRRDGNLHEAADYYTAEAYGYFMRFRPPPDFVDERAREGKDTHPDPGQLGFGLRALLLAALCYRMSESPDRAVNRSKQGILLVEDLRDNEPIFERTPHQAWCYEAVGDLRLFGDLEGYDDAYAEAECGYEGTDNPIQWQSEYEFEFLIQPLIRLAESVGHDLSDETAEAIRRRSLTERIAYKQREYPDIVAAVLEAGNGTPRNCDWPS